MDFIYYLPCFSRLFYFSLERCFYKGRLAGRPIDLDGLINFREDSNEFS